MPEAQTIDWPTPSVITTTSGRIALGKMCRRTIEP